MLLSQGLIEKVEICDSCRSELVFDFKSSSFIKNNEYSNAFTKGFTGIGYFLKPSLIYRAGDRIQLKLGAFLQQFSGLNSFTEKSPMYSVEFKASEKVHLVIGSIYGNLSHRLEEPLYRFDNYYQHNIENGFQIFWKSKSFKSELWLNWQDFIFQGEDKQEKFQIGYTSKLSLLKNDFKISIPVQILLSHKGGEIDTSPDLASSILNIVSGISFEFAISKEHSLELEPMWFIYDGISIPDQGVNSQIFDKGHAYYIKLNYNYKAFTVMMAYWNADSFISPGGESLFHSISDFDAMYSEKKRELYNAKLEWTKSISNFASVVLRADSYYDKLNKEMSHSMGFYLILKEEFFISRLK